MKKRRIEYVITIIMLLLSIVLFTGCDNPTRNGMSLPARYSLTVIGGTITAGSSGARAWLAAGTNVTVTTNVPAAGQEFINWEFSGITETTSAANTFTFTMPANAVTLKANFSPTMYNIAWTVDPADAELAANIFIADEDETGALPETVAYNNPVKFKVAAPPDGYFLASVSAGYTALIPANSVYSHIVTGDVKITAIYTSIAGETPRAITWIVDPVSAGDAVAVFKTWDNYDVPTTVENSTALRFKVVTPANYFLDSVSAGSSVLKANDRIYSHNVNRGVTITATFKPTDVLLAWDSENDPLTEVLADSTTRQMKNSEFWFGARGDIANDNGAFKLGGVMGSAAPRLIIGSGSGMSAADPAGEDTSGTVHLPGQLNLSEGTFRFTIDYKDVAGTLDGSNNLMRVYINNNTRGNAGSVLGNNTGQSNVIRTYGNTPQLAEGRGGILEVDGIIDEAINVVPGADNTVLTSGTLILTFTPGFIYRDNPAKDSLINAFMALYCQALPDQDQYITITGIKLERMY